MDEPGYTPGYDVGKSSFAAQSESAKAAPEPEPAPEPAYDFAPANEPEPATPEPVASTASADDPLGGMDPMEWLESLAARQGASADELTTEANFDIAEPPADTFIDEPGYVDYDPFGGSGVARPAEPAASAPEPEAQPAASMEGDTLSWLEDMAAQQNADAESLIGEITPEPEAAPTQNYAADAPFPSITPAESSAEPESALSWLEDLAKGQTGMLDAMTLDSSPQPASINEGGMSDDINEVQAWLESQARNLEQTRVELDEQDNPDNLAPAEPATDLPDWLRASMPASGGATTEAPKAPALSDEIATPNAPSDLPNWLRPTPEPSADLEQDLLASIQDAGGTSTAEPVQDLANISDEELEALTRPSSPDEVDSWAEALDEEFDRKAAGDESVPDWYQEAIKRAEAQKPRSGPVPTVTEVPEPSIQAPAASTSNVPDWLQEDSFADSAAALPGDIPDWLRTVAPEAPTSPAQAALPAASTEIPDWLQAAAPTPAPAPVTPPPVQQAPAPEPRPRPAPTPPPAPSARPVEAARVRPATPPGPEHQEHLQTARQMVASSQYPASLEHYQALIDSAQLLEETRGDLRQLVENQPADPKLRRLLGDAHMRLGDLQAALDTYRSALDQL